MKEIKNSKIIKSICYCLVPILTLIIILNSCSVIYYANYEDDFENKTSYIETTQFANDYFSAIVRALRISENERKYIQKNTDILISDSSSNEEEHKTEEKTEMSIEEYEPIQYNFYTIRRYEVLVISPYGDVITNVGRTTQTDSIEKIKQYLSGKQYYWNYDGKNIETNIDKLAYEEIAYQGFAEIKQSGYEIYTALKEQGNAEFYVFNLVYDFVISTYQTAPSVILVSTLLLCACIIYIIISIGHKEGKEGIYTNGFDHIPYEAVIIVASILLTIEGVFIWMCIDVMAHMVSKIAIDSAIMAMITLGFVMYITIVATIVTTLRRIKAHIFWKNTLVYSLSKFVLGGLFTNLSQTMKLAVQYGGFIVASSILVALTFNQMPVISLVLLGFWYYVFKKMLDYQNQMYQVREKINKMYHGDIEVPLEEDALYGELKQVAKELNDISGGLSNAIEEATKSERLKTELITNVSHDIKTPLTSIINYVDLMKQEKIDNPKVQEYLEVLDSKSQRLKKLTEDLIEASKASSGNIKLTMETLNVKELVKQISGEFEDRFSKKNLQIIESFPSEEVNIRADSRYLYRVMENMYVNIAKYALEGSRVYVDVVKQNGNVQIHLKNISEDKLNISVDELMERFVRGDEARTKEGSGLGISIAKSLTELQKGKFDIHLDGDLFKVVIEFEEIET